MRGLGVRAGEPRAILLGGAHLLALSAFALAQPLFDLLARSPEFFVVRGSTRGEIVAFALGLVLLPPAILLAVELVARLAGPRPRVAVHLLFVGALAAAIAAQALKRLADGPGLLLLAAAALAGAIAAFAYVRASAARTVLTVLAAAPLLFLGLFLLGSPVSRVAVSGGAEEVPAGPPVPATTPIVFVVLDELPTTSLMNEGGTIDAVRYPSFAALARDSTWFRNATTVHEHSTEAVPSMLTGEYPKEGRLPFLADHPENLFTLLAPSYGFDVFESVTHLCPPDLCPRRGEPFLARMAWLSSDLSIVYLHVLLPEDLSAELPPVTHTWMNFGRGARAGDQAGVDERIDALVGREFSKDQRVFFETFVASIPSRREPTLYFLHVMLPHAPWQYLPSGTRYHNGIPLDGINIDTWWEDEWLVTQGFQRHLLQAAFVDRLLGRLLARLRATGLYDRSLLVVLADHGVSFRPGERRRGATATNLEDIAFVPLFVKEPRQRAGRVVDEHVQTVDLLPSVADGARIPLPWATAGRSFLAPAYRGDAEVRVYRRAGEAPVVLDFASLVRRRDATLAKQVRLFGSGHRGPGLFGIGPHARGLLGRPLEALSVSRQARSRVQLDGGELLLDVDLDSGVVPARITGRMEGASARADLAVAVNGRIAAVTRTFELDGTSRFSALVPEAAFRDGANDVDVFVVHGAGREMTLEPTAS